MLPVLVILIGGWLEEQEDRAQTEQAKSRQDERETADRRRKTLSRFHKAIDDALTGANSSPASLILVEREAILRVLQSALPEADGQGKGEMLALLYEKELLTGALSGAVVTGLDFSRAVLTKAHLAGADLSGINLTQARLDDADLVNCRLSGANLARAFLRHANLHHAVLAEANLENARLDGANLEGCDLRNARLEDAVFAYANLRNAVLEDPRRQTIGATPGAPLIDQAVLIETLIPDGSKVTNLKGKAYLQKKEIATLIDRL